MTDSLIYPGMALSSDPSFNLIKVLYPFIVTRLLFNPSDKIRSLFVRLITDSDGNKTFCINYQCMLAVQYKHNA